MKQQKSENFVMEEEVVYIKVLDKKKRDVVFEGKVSTNVEPHELTKLRCFRERKLDVICNKTTNKQVTSFKGLQNNVELLARPAGYNGISGVLYVGAEDGVVRKINCVPSCECVMMSVWRLSQEECEEIFRCKMLEIVEMFFCPLRQIPREIGKMKKLNNLRLQGLLELKSIPEEIGELSSLKELQIGWCGVERLPKRLKELKMLKSISLTDLSNLLLYAEDLVVFSKLKRLTIWNSKKAFTPPFTDAFWEMIKTTTDLRVLELHWNRHNQEIAAAALQENGSIVDGGQLSESYAHIFKRNKENHDRVMECVVRMLASRRWRNTLNNIPKEMVRMIAMMLWNTRADVKTWSKEMISF
jgi:hypothetical protein